jgi:glycosyltransferase involved in cell wall biosynthesis
MRFFAAGTPVFGATDAFLGLFDSPKLHRIDLRRTPAVKLALLAHDFCGWSGGLQYIRVQADAIRAADPSVELIIALPTGAYAGDAFDGLDGLDVLFGRPFDIAHLMNMDLVLPVYGVPPGWPRPWLGYLYDFQHKHHPAFFSPNELEQRDRHFAALLNSARHVICNSRSVADDARTFFEPFSAAVHPMPFAAYAQDGWLEYDDPELLETYGIVGPYFIVCNQFWVHKDHPTAFRALANLKSAGMDVTLVCTGAVDDYRAPTYANQLQFFAEKLGVTGLLKVLGHIPKLHQVALMKRSLAVIQPTLFEGGPLGGAGYNAVGLGVPLLCSDLPVNREADAGDISWFKPGDDIELAGQMWAIAKNSPKRPTIEVLRAAGRARLERLGQALLAAAREAIAAAG